MISLKENERVLMTLHKHWLVIVGKMTVLIVLGCIPYILLAFAHLIPFIRPESSYPLILLISAALWLGLLVLFYIDWLDYWLDTWIITDLRIIDIEQKGLFRREVSEFFIAQVQDVTIETPGMLGSFLNFGNITVQTAGEQNFSAYSIPDINEAKKCILDCVHKKRLASSESGVV